MSAYRESARPPKATRKTPARYWMATLAVALFALVAQANAWVAAATVVLGVAVFACGLVAFGVVLGAVNALLDADRSARVPAPVACSAAALGCLNASMLVMLWQPSWLPIMPAASAAVVSLTYGLSR